MKPKSLYIGLNLPFKDGYKIRYTFRRHSKIS